jgi:hypothetical protein
MINIIKVRQNMEKKRIIFLSFLRPKFWVSPLAVSSRMEALMVFHLIIC